MSRTVESYKDEIACTEDDFAYIAGYFDGEGCFYIYNDRAYIVCENTHEPTVRWLREKLGGTVVQKTKARPRRRAVYRWIACTNRAVAICQYLTPYLKEKMRQAAMIIAHYQYKQLSGYSKTSLKKIRDDFSIKIKEAKGRVYE